jgi:muramidase (phage lysozyme)
MDRGFNNLLWFLGVVEDNNDPQSLGRVRARAFGIHPQSKDDVPTEDLPWAFIVSGTYDAAYKPPELNSWVWGFFIDGKGAQQPVLLGVMLGMPTMIPGGYGDSNSGFSAMGDGSTLDKVFKPDISDLARGENIQSTSVMAKNVTGGESVNGAGGKNWATPKSPYNAQYPHNWVKETKSGHVMEFDDTPGHERVNIYHRSGSHIEMNSSGQTTFKSVGSAFFVMESNGYIRIKGDANVTVEGVANINCENDVNLSVDGNLNQTVFGDYSLSVSGRADFNVGESIRMRGAKVGIESAADNIDIISKNNMNIQSGSNVNMKASGNMATTASRVDFNSEDKPAADASPSDLKAPAQRKTVAKKTMVDPLDMGIAHDDTGSEPVDTGNPSETQAPTNSDSGDPKLETDRSRYQSTLNQIGAAEGTDKGRGYNETLGYGKFTGGNVDLESMTLGEVKKLQGQMLANPENKFNSSALGRYQITRETIRDFQGRLNLPDSTKFDRATQDRIAIAILKQTGGNVTKLRGRWQGLNKISSDQIRNSYWSGA